MEISEILAITTPIVSLIVAIIVASRKKNKDIKDEAQKVGQMQSDLGYIKSGIDDLKKAQIRHDEKLDILSERITKVESNLESHVRDRNIHSYVKKTNSK